MATGTKTGTPGLARGGLQMFRGQSAANTAQTISTDTLCNYKILHIEVAYSAAPTQAGVTVTLNSAIGSAYDTLIASGSANAQYTSYVPSSGDYTILQGDAIDVLAPAGGAGITSNISIYVEAL